jgi:hypothetical protein
MTMNKRQKERHREEKRKEKEEKRQQRKSAKDDRPVTPPGEDPDIAGIVPGPQPLPEEFQS